MEKKEPNEPLDPEAGAKTLRQVTVVLMIALLWTALVLGIGMNWSTIREWTANLAP